MCFLAWLILVRWLSREYNETLVLDKQDRHTASLPGDRKEGAMLVILQKGLPDVGMVIEKIEHEAGEPVF